MRISDWSSDVCSSDLRRPKSDRLDTGLLKRSFLGWLRGERGHCTMAPVPTLSEEDARRPNREHSSLTGEQTRIINRLKSTLARFGVRDFNVKRPDAGDRLEAVRTPEGEGDRKSTRLNSSH